MWQTVRPPMLADPKSFHIHTWMLPPSAHAVLTAFTLRSSVSQKPAPAGWYYSFLSNVINNLLHILIPSRLVFVFVVIVFDHLRRNHCDGCQYAEYDLLHFLPPSTTKQAEPLWLCLLYVRFSVLVQPCQIGSMPPFMLMGCVRILLSTAKRRTMASRHCPLHGYSILLQKSIFQDFPSHKKYPLFCIKYFIAATMEGLAPYQVLQSYCEHDKMENFIKKGKSGFDYSIMIVNANRLHMYVLEYNLFD